MILILVSTEWTSMLFFVDLEKELDRENIRDLRLEISKKFLKMRLWIGLKLLLMVLFFDELILFSLNRKS